MDAGADHESDSWLSLGVTLSKRGALGAPNGVVVAGVELAPAPGDVKAETRNAYAVPLERPATVTEVEVVPVSLTATNHEVPPFEEISTR